MAEVDRQGRDLAESWDRHFIGLKQLQVDPDARFAALAALAEWAATLQDVNPARHLLQSAHETGSFTLTQRRAALDGQRQALEGELGTLYDERQRLEAGDDMTPPLPYTRDASVRSARQGAPFWQVVDFRDAVAAPQRTGFEAALEAAGLSDAWISPDGRPQAGDDGVPLYDTQVLERRRSSPSRLRTLWKLPCRPAVPYRPILSSVCYPASHARITTQPTQRPGSPPTAGIVSAPSRAPGASRRRSISAMRARAAARTRRLAEIAARLAQRQRN